MLTKVGVATLVGTAFVVGNSYGYSHTSTGITKTSVAYDDLLGFGLAKDGYTPGCSGAPKIFKGQCECVIDNCESLLTGFITGSSPALTCIKDNCLGGDSLKCFLTCASKDKGTGGKELFQCAKENKCLLF